jgi:nitrite reductase/ring-hydroxylating ferredoxin subunit
MKKYISLLLITGLLLGCSKDKARNNNPYIPSYQFSTTLNLSLPLYSQLNSNGNSITITDPTGIEIIILRVSETDYRAWNAYCPNQAPTACSKMSTSHTDPLNVTCSCDNIKYSLFTGIGNNNAPYTLVPYRVEILGGSIRVYN